MVLGQYPWYSWNENERKRGAVDMEENLVEMSKKDRRAVHRNPEMEKAFAQMAKYVKDNEEDPNLQVEFYIQESIGLVVCRVEYIPEVPEEMSAEELVAYLDAKDDNYVSYGHTCLHAGDKWNTLIGKYFALKHAKNTRIPVSILTALGYK